MGGKRGIVFLATRSALITGHLHRCRYGDRLSYERLRCLTG